MTNQEAINYLTLHAKYWIDTKSPTLEALNYAIKALRDLEEAKEIFMILRGAAVLDKRMESVKFISEFLGKLE